MLNARRRPVRKLGSFLFALLMLSSVRRSKWLLSRGALPSTEIVSRPAPAVTEADLELCERLIRAHAMAIGEDGDGRQAEGMWSWIFDARQQGLAEALSSGDPNRLALLMSSMFDQDFVLGMAPGPLLGQTKSGLTGRAWGLKCLDALASMGEVLGVTAVENPEQGGTGLAFEAGLPGCLEAIESELGFRLDFPDVGAATGLAVEGRLLTPDTPDQVYAAVRLDQALELHLGSADGEAPLKVVEIGGGYGGMCLWFLRRRPTTTAYTIVDLPIVNAIQGYFLGRALGGEAVSFLGEPAAQVRVLPNSALDEVEAPFDVLVNKDSLPEMPATVMDDYLRWGADNCRGLFYSYNQEAAMEFLAEAQGIVHRSVDALGGFQRLRRDRAWVRDGYVEEIYVPSAAAAQTR